MSDEVPTLEDLKSLRVVDLKKELVRLGLPQGGVKAELVQRIFDHYQDAQGGGGDAEEGEEEAAAGEDSNGAQEEETPEPSKESSLEPEEPTPESSKEPSLEPEEEPTPEPSKEPTPEPEEEPTPEPSKEPTPEPEEEPTLEPSKEPTPEPEEPTPESAKDPSPEPVEETSPEVAKEQSPEPMEQEEEEEVPQERSKLSVQFGPPKVHPAGAPPVPVEEYVPPQEEEEEEEEQGQEQEQEQIQEKMMESSPQKEQERVEPPVVEPPSRVEERRAQPPPTVQPQVQQYQEEEEEAEEEGDEEDTRGEDDSGKENKKGQKLKKKKKKKKKNRPEQWALQAVHAHRRKMEEERQKTEQEVEVEYIQEQLELEPTDPLYRTFNKIFQAFQITEDPVEKEKEKEEEERKHAEEFKKVPKMLEEDDMLEERELDGGGNKISKRKLKKLSRLSVAELKQLVSRPDVVEMHDVTARDPRLLVHLKSTRNTVPVPRHWCFKRKYLQGKRGIEKPPFDLPDFIKKTGIMEMREALQEKEDAKGMKAKQREKVRPKLGKIDIDYQKLHDAFFKWQTKPRMTMHGDLYYEGKEFEIRLKEKKPGDLTDDLRTALGMPVGPNAHKVPPPWLIAMQRYGPPPSYPNLKIAGLNAPIPDGCSFGYHAGGWGKPPVDEAGKPLYGDVFGTSDNRSFQATPAEDIDQTLWGEMESESEEESESEDEEDEEEEEGADSGLQTPVVEPGLATPSGTTSVGGAGLETPDMIELRKRRIEADMEGGDTPSLPYTIIPERRNERIGASMMGSTHTYDLGKSRAPGGKGKEAAVEMALNPEDLDLMDSEGMALKAEAALREQQASLAKEDLSDMVAEHAAKQKNKRKRQEQKDDKEKSKKYKEFKF